MFSSQTFRENIPPFAAAVRNIIVFTAVLTIPLVSAQNLGLDRTQTSSWIFALYAVPTLLALLLTLRYRIPIVLTGNIFIIIFISRLGGDIAFPALVGAAIVTGVAVLLINALGLSARLAALVPMPIVFGLLAGAVMPFVIGIFTQIGAAPLMVGGTFLVYLASRLLSRQIPAILPALLAGVVLAALTGQIAPLTSPLTVELPHILTPEFSLPAIIAVGPVFIILIVVQANLPALLYLRSQDYDPPESVIRAVSGIGTILGSFFGPTGVSLSLPATSLSAGPEAGEHHLRHRSVYYAGAVALLVGLLSGIAADLAAIFPTSLLLALAGLAVVDVLISALARITAGPLILGPVFTLVIALSDISLLGFGSFFWALILGPAISFLLERDALKAMRTSQEPDTD